MRKRRHLLLVVSLVLFLAPARALAWNSAGHMVVGRIAYDRLTPAAKARVDELAALLTFGNRRYTPVTMGVFMDDVRGEPYYDSLRPLHFINKPYFDGVEKDAALEKESVGDANLLTQLNKTVERLKAMAASRGPRTAASARDEAEQLALLMHMVGDAHQPMHCVSRFTPENPTGDRGGNLFFLKGDYSTLHSFWDYAGGWLKSSDFRISSNPQTMRKTDENVVAAAERAKRAYADDNADWKEMSFEKWVDESYEVAVNFAYKKISEGADPDSNEYDDETRKICRALLARAGYRLAAQINDIYKEGAAPRPRARRR